MSLRVGGWLGALALVIAWWFASLEEPQVARERAQTPSDQPAANDSTTSAFTERLRRGLSRAPASPSPRRNPFQFATREPDSDRTAPPSVSAAPPPGPPPAALTLAGIATSEAAEGPVRTAVLSDATGIILVKAGDELPNGLRVVRVGEDHIVLTDAAGTETILHLK